MDSGVGVGVGLGGGGGGGGTRRASILARTCFLASGVFIKVVCTVCGGVRVPGVRGGGGSRRKGALPPGRRDEDE